METTPKSVQLSIIVKFYRRKARRTSNPSSRKNLSLVTKCFEEWGDLVVYQDQDQRYMVADSVAHRLQLSPTFVRARMDDLHRRANYDDQGREGDN